MFDDLNKQNKPTTPQNGSFNPPPAMPAGNPSYGPKAMPSQPENPSAGVNNEYSSSFNRPRTSPPTSGYSASNIERPGIAENPPPAPPIRQPQPAMSIPITQQNVLTEEEQSEMLKRDKLSKVQKIILIVITVVVLGALIGGGIWLVYSLDLFGSKTNANANANTNGAVLNGNANKKLNANVNSGKVNANANGNTNKTLKIITNAANTVDEDHDGLSGDQELQYGTDPNNPDTDTDGYTDGDEVKNGYNPIGEGKLVQ